MKITGENESCSIKVHDAKVYNDDGKLIYTLHQVKDGTVLFIEEDR